MLAWTLSVLRQMLDGSDELEVLREEETCPGQHQLVTLTNGDVSYPGNICDNNNIKERFILIAIALPAISL